MCAKPVVWQLTTSVHFGLISKYTRDIINPFKIFYNKEYQTIDLKVYYKLLKLFFCYFLLFVIYLYNRSFINCWILLTIWGSVLMFKNFVQPVGIQPSTKTCLNVIPKFYQIIHPNFHFQLFRTLNSLITWGFIFWLLNWNASICR